MADAAPEFEPVEHAVALWRGASSTSRFHDWPLLLGFGMVVLLAALAGGVAAQLANLPIELVGWIAGVCGVIAGLSCWIIWATRRKRQFSWTFQLQNEGASIRRGDQIVRVPDASICGVAFSHGYADWAKGRPLEVATRLWLGSPTGEQIELRWLCINTVDPLWGWRERIVNALAEHVETDLVLGGSVAGDGWRLDRDVLHVRKHGRWKPFPIGDLHHVDDSDGVVKIFTRHGSMPAHRVPSSGTNAALLCRLLRKHVESREAIGFRAPLERDKLGLGVKLFEIKQPLAMSSMFAVALAVVMCLPIAFVVIGLVSLIVQGKLDLPVIGFALLVVLVCAGVILACIVDYRNRQAPTVACHEHGIVTRKWFKPTTIRYDEVTSLAVKFRANLWGPARAQIRSELPDAKPRSAVLANITARGGNGEYTFISDEISRLIGRCHFAVYERMATALANEGRVRWSRDVEFLRERLLVTRRGEKVFVPFGSIRSWESKGQKFTIHVDGCEIDKIVMAESGPNFGPGHALLCAILSPETEDDGESEESEEKGGGREPSLN